MKIGPCSQNVLQFADDCSCGEILGQVDTYWTFEEGKRMTTRSGILEHCSSDVILREDVLIEHDVFSTCTSCIAASELSKDFLGLAPFTFITRW